jgi:hypothetical protein
MKPAKKTDDQRIADEVDKTLLSLDGIERATPKPFFLTRTQTRLSQRMAPKQLTAWVFRPVWLVASLGLILVLNVSSMVYIQQRLSRYEQEQHTVNFSAEWGLSTTGLNW